MSSSPHRGATDAAGATTQPYLTSARWDAITYDAALCISGVLQIAGAAALAPVAPPLSALGAISGGLALSGCIGLAPATLLPSITDEQLKSLSSITGVFSPALFWTPAAAVIGGSEGVRAALVFGPIVFDLLNLRPDSVERLPYYLLDPKHYADEYLLFADTKSAFTDYFHLLNEQENPNEESNQDDLDETNGSNASRDIPDVPPPGGSDSTDYDGGEGWGGDDEGWGGRRRHARRRLRPVNGVYAWDNQENEMPNDDRGIITRREILATTATTAALLSLAEPSIGQTSSLRNLFAPSRSVPKTEVQSRIVESEWTRAKRRVISSGRFPWLQSMFQDDTTVDQIVYDVTNRLVLEEPKYDPYQVEQLVSSTSTLLDRCLVYRRDMYDLEEKAIRRALEYQLFQDQLAPQKSIERSDFVQRQRELERDGQGDAANKFGALNEALPQGFAAISAKNRDSLDQAVQAEIGRKQNVDVKWDALEKFQTALQDRHKTPGNALNYAERYARVRGFLEEDIAIAFQKIRCVALSVKKIWGIDSPLQLPSEVGYLDYLVTYLRGVIYEVERRTVEEVDFEHIVSLRQPHAKPQYQIINDPVWNQTLDPNTGGGLLTFTLKDEFLPVFSRLRIRAIGLSYEIDVPGDTAARLRSMAAVVVPPRAENLFSPGSQKSRPPVVIEGVGIYDPLARPNMYALSSVQNIDPREDQWQVQVSSNMIWPDAASHGKHPANIRDLKLHLKLSAIYTNKDTSSWIALNW